MANTEFTTLMFEDGHEPSVIEIQTRTALSNVNTDAYKIEFKPNGVMYEEHYNGQKYISFIPWENIAVVRQYIADL